MRAWGLGFCVLALLSRASSALSVPRDDNEFKSSLQDQILISKSHKVEPADDELIGGFGRLDPIPVEERAQSSSLLQEDEHAGADEDEYAEIHISNPEPADLTGEAMSQVDTNTVMQSNGIGHMIGTNDVTKDKPDSDVVQAVQMADSQIAEIKGLLNMLKDESKVDERTVQQLKLEEDERIHDVQASYDKKVAELKLQMEERLRSAKRESAIMAKSARQEQEETLNSKSSKISGDLLELKHDAEKKLQDMNEQIEALKARKHEADNKAETVYAHNRAAWKVKHTQELEAKGAHTQIEKTRSDLEAERSKLEKLKRDEAELKQKLRDDSREKILMAARVKNLHAREQDLKRREAELAKANEDLKRSLADLKVSGSEVKEEADKAQKVASQTLVEAEKTAKSTAQAQREKFERETLKKAQDEVASLKQQLGFKIKQEARLEQELLQQAQNAVVEKKQADEALAKAKWDKAEAERQAEIEVQKALEKVNEIENEGFLKASEIREKARDEGMNEGVQEVHKEEEKIAKQGKELQKEEVEGKRLIEEFKEKAKRKLEEQRAEFKHHLEEERKEMRDKLQKEQDDELQKLKEAQDKRIEETKKEIASTRNYVEKSEQRISDLEHSNASLKQQIAQLEDQSAHIKEEWAHEQLFTTPEIAPKPLPALL